MVYDPKSLKGDGNTEPEKKKKKPRNKYKEHRDMLLFQH